MKKMISDTQFVLDRYSPLSRDEMVEMMDRALAALPEGSRAGARFEVDLVSYPYDSSDYPKLLVKFERLETDAEEAKREAEEARMAALREERERAEFERLSAKFAKSGS